MKKTNNIKYFFLSIFALLLLVIFSSNRAMAVELDTVWVSDINGQVLFQHPVTKNILVATNGGITELNSQDGKFARKLPINGNCIEMSPDGTKILYCADDGVRVFDYNTFEDYLAITTKYWHPKFLGNDKIVFLSGIKANTEIGVYNIQNKDLRYYPFFSEDFTAFSTSPDGKYISYGTYEEYNGIDSKAYLYLLDAETMKEITELGNWNTEGHYITRIHFSLDSKYLTFTPGSYQKDFSINIYNLINNTVSKNINPLNFDYQSTSVLLLDNNYYLIRGYNLFNETTEIRICKLDNNEVIYLSNDYMKYIQTAVFESNKNYLYCNTPAKKTFCYDLNNIISSIPQKNLINLGYIQKKLMINNNIPIHKISIMTIEGREVYKQNFESLITMNNPIEIPLELSNGLYIINITSGKESFTEKIIVLD